MFHEVFKKLEVFKSEIKAVAVDAGYKTPGIMREIIQRGMIPVVPYKRPMTKKGFFKKVIIVVGTVSKKSMINTMTAIYVQPTNCYIILLLIEKATVSIKAIH